LTASGSASDIVSTYYTDARVLPTYAVDDEQQQHKPMLSSTHPNVSTQSANASDPCGSEVHRPWSGLLGQPIASNVVAANYIVGRSTGGNQNTQSVQPSPPTLSNIVDLAASSSSYNIDFCIEGDKQNKALYSVCSD